MQQLSPVAQCRPAHGPCGAPPVSPPEDDPEASPFPPDDDPDAPSADEGFPESFAGDDDPASPAAVPSCRSLHPDMTEHPAPHATTTSARRAFGDTAP